ncbi:gp300 [Bacillus phage G]|uniref:Gp300 n=1 Tax=Bacillus phage G TaxID=2884420 RepID=G3MA41_9CAUD|nr:gp300 [Bacillus phage G]AEO93559.1 gp300 [Bacillus phage G]
MSELNKIDSELEVVKISGDLEVNKSQETLDQVLFEDFQKNLKEEEIEFDKAVEETSKLEVEQAVYDYLNGENGAFDFIHNHYRPILERLAYRKGDDELAQELSIVLYHAVLKYDILADVKFNTFFWTCARNHIGTQNIRKNAQKRSGAKKMEVTRVNPETGEEETVVEVVKTKVISLQSTVKNKDAETELGNFVESDYTKLDYKKLNLELSLNQIKEAGIINKKEMTAIRMVIEGATLIEIGEALGNITAPAVHVMLRRLGKKDRVINHLLDILK